MLSRKRSPFDVAVLGFEPFDEFENALRDTQPFAKVVTNSEEGLDIPTWEHMFIPNGLVQTQDRLKVMAPVTDKILDRPAGPSQGIMIALPISDILSVMRDLLLRKPNAVIRLRLPT